MSRRSLAHQSSGTFPQRSESSHQPASVIYRELGNSRALRRQGSLRWKVAFIREEAGERAAKGEGWRLDGLTEHRGSPTLDTIGPEIIGCVIEISNAAGFAMRYFPLLKTFSWTACIMLIFKSETAGIPLLPGHIFTPHFLFSVG